MTASYNGWSASPNRADFGGLDDQDVPGAPGVKLAPGLRAGDVATVLLSFAALFHAHVEPLKTGQCWGYNYRPDTNDPRKLSCHASGTAIDLNAPEHPNGKRGTFTQQQVSMIRALLAGYDGVIGWGGDFTGTDDEMHFEITGSPAQVAAMAAKLNGHTSPAPAPQPSTGSAAEANAHPTGHDATGHGTSFRAEEGDQGPGVHQLQHELNRFAPAYSHLVEDGTYGQHTADVVEEFDHRAAHDPALAHDAKALQGADGENVGPAGARALNHYGLNL